MSLSDQLNKSYVPKQDNINYDAIEEAAWTLFQQISEEMIEKAQKGEVERNGYMFGKYIRVSKKYGGNRSVPKGTVKINKGGFLVNTEDFDTYTIYTKLMINELKRLATKEGIVMKHNSPTSDLHFMHKIK